MKVNLKKLGILFFAFVFVSLNVSAQDAKKLMKEAKKSIEKYSQDMKANEASLKEGLGYLDQAFAIPGTSENPEWLIEKGNIYSNIADNIVKQLILNPKYKVPVADAANQATDAYLAGLALADKKKQKDALKGLTGVEQYLFNLAITAYQNEDTKGAFGKFAKAIEVSNVLKANGEKSRLDDKVAYDEIYYFTVVSGYSGGVKEPLIPYLTKMDKDGTDKPVVYQILYELNAEKNEAEADKYLEMGRTKFPEDSGLLFTEINQALKKGQFEALVGKLKAAIVAEPNNISIYNTLGSVYEQLAKKAGEAGNEAEVNKDYDEALSWYQKGLEVKPDNFESIYSIGALYYNKAAKTVEEVNKFSSDYSAAGTKNYNIAKDKMLNAFKEALPYFEKCEAINPKDGNTLIAMKEIYARIGKLDKVAEYKAKLEAAGK